MTTNISYINFILAANITLLLTLSTCCSALGTSNRPLMSSLSAKRIHKELTSPWVEFGKIKKAYKPLDFGQGLADYDAAPPFLLEALHNVTTKPDIHLYNQYSRSYGHPRLVKALLDYYRRRESFAANEEILADFTDENEQILVTIGAYEAIFATIMAFVDDGDEVVLIEPTFDAYAPMVSMAKGKNVFVTLRLRQALNNSSITSNDFVLDMAELESKLSNKTKLLVLNTPNNPLGKMYSRRELEAIAKLAVKYNFLVLADEVYDQIYFDDNNDRTQHLSIASLPGMWERTVTVGSAGKTFSVTGWKIGWAVGSRPLIKALQLVHQNVVYTTPTPLQEAIARTFAHELSKQQVDGLQSYWSELRRDLLQKRNRLAQILRDANVSFVLPQGGYFMLVDLSPLRAGTANVSNMFLAKVANLEAQAKPEAAAPAAFDEDDDNIGLGSAKWLAETHKLLAIPAKVFYSPENKNLAPGATTNATFRFCFIKSNATLDMLDALFKDLNSNNKKKKAS